MLSYLLGWEEAFELRVWSPEIYEQGHLTVGPCARAYSFCSLASELATDSLAAQS